MDLLFIFKPADPRTGTKLYLIPTTPSAAQIGLLLPWRASALGWRICSCEISAGDLAAKLPIDPLRRAGFALARLGLGARRCDS